MVTTRDAPSAEHAAHADPLGGLLFFHRSIRAALEALDEVCALADQGEVDGVRAVALHEFFTGPMQWHDQDERESVLPRLARADPAYADAIEASVAEHAEVSCLVDGILRHLKELADGVATPQVGRLRMTAAGLRAVLEPHLQREEQRVFPHARAVLGDDDLAQIAREIAVRRAQRLPRHPQS